MNVDELKQLLKDNLDISLSKEITYDYYDGTPDIELKIQIMFDGEPVAYDTILVSG